MEDNKELELEQETPIVEEPTTEEPVEETPAVEETPIAEEVPVEEPTQEETPAETPIVEETPVVEEEPVLEPAVVEETPVAEAPVVEAVQEKAPIQKGHPQRGPRKDGPKGKDFRKREPRPKLYDEEIINIGRVTKVTKGGRNFRFSATVAVGDRKGKVGIGTGKANEVPDAVKKAVAAATKNIIVVSVVNGTIPHEATGKRSGARVLIKPAGKGTGVKAGGAVRSVVELAGVKDILSKSLGSSTKINVANATLDALKSLKTIEQVAALRGKTVEEIK